MRLRGVSEDGENLTSLVPELQKYFDAYGTGVQLVDEATGAFNSTYDILNKLSGSWATLTDLQRANITELVAGKRSSDTLNAVLSNTETLTNALTTSQESYGSALEENNIYMDSAQAKINQFNQAVQDMWQNTISSDTIKTIVSFGTEIINLVDGIGLLNTAFLIFIGLNLTGTIPILSTLIGKLGVSIMTTTGATLGLASAMTAITTIGIGVAIIGIIKGMDALNLSIDEQTEKISGLTSEYNKLNSEYNELVALQTSGEATKAQERKIKNLEEELRLTNETIKAEKEKLSQIELSGERFDKIASIYLNRITEITNIFTKTNYEFGAGLEGSLEAGLSTLGSMTVGSDSYNKLLSELYIKSGEIQDLYSEMGEEVPSDILKMINSVDSLWSVENEVQLTLEEFNRTLREIPEPEETITPVERAFNGVKDAINGALDVVSNFADEGHQKTITEYNELVDSFSDNLNELSSIYTQVNEGERISLSTIRALANEYPEYANQIYRINMETSDRIGILDSLINAQKEQQIKAIEGLRAEHIALNNLNDAYSRFYDNVDDPRAEHMVTMLGMPDDLAVYDFMIQEVNDSIEDVINTYSEVEDSVDSTTDSTEDLIDASEEYLTLLEEQVSLQKELAQEQKEASEEYYDNLIDAKNDELDALQESYETRISSEQAILDGMESQSDELEKQRDLADKLLTLEQARQELFNVEQERNARILTDEGWQWIANPDAVASAQEALLDAQSSYNDEVLEQEEEARQQVVQDRIDALEEQQELEEKALNDRIDVLEAEKEAQQSYYDAIMDSLDDLLDTQQSLYEDAKYAEADVIDLLIEKYGEYSTEVESARDALASLGLLSDGLSSGSSATTPISGSSYNQTSVSATSGGSGLDATGKYTNINDLYNMRPDILQAVALGAQTSTAGESLANVLSPLGYSATDISNLITSPSTAGSSSDNSVTINGDVNVTTEDSDSFRNDFENAVAYTQ